MTDDTTETEEAQLSLDLPEFEGHKPIGVMTRLNGAGQRIVRPLGIEDKVVLLVEAVVADVNHKTTKDGIKRVHTLAVADLYEVEGTKGRNLLGKARRQHEADLEARHGIKRLPGTEPTEGVTYDENGTVLTDDEVAAARGDQPSECRIVIFEDQSRAAWPEDWTGSVPADPNDTPAAGFHYSHPAKEFELEMVVEIQDENGDTIEKAE